MLRRPASTPPTGPSRLRSWPVARTRAAMDAQCRPRCGRSRRRGRGIGPLEAGGDRPYEAISLLVGAPDAGAARPRSMPAAGAGRHAPQTFSGGLCLRPQGTYCTRWRRCESDRAGMLFNSYPFLLAFLPGAVAVFAIINRYPRLRIPCLLVFSLLFYGYWNPAFVLLLIGSILVNWFAARQFAATRNNAIITAAIVLNLAVLGLFKYADFFTGSVAALGGFSHRPSGFRAAARHQLLHLPPHHVSCGPAPRSRGGHHARPLCALHLLLSAGGGRSARALVGGGAAVRARCVRRRLGAALRAWHHLHHDRPDRKGRVRRSDRPDPGSDLSGRRDPPRCTTAPPGSRWASGSRSSSTSPAIPTLRSASGCCSAFSSRSTSTRRSAPPASWCSGSAGT